MALTMIDPASSWFEIDELPIVEQLYWQAVNSKELLIADEIFDKTSEHIAKLVNKIWLCRYPRCCYFIYNNGSEFKLHFEYLCESYGITCKPTMVNSLTAKSVLAGEKLVLFGSYVLCFYVGIAHYILCETKTWHAKIYLPTQCTNWRILTSAKKIKFWPSTHVINAASFVKIASNSRQAEVIVHSTRYQTLWMDKSWQETTVLRS